MSLPVSRPTRRAMLVASPACRASLVSVLHQLQFPCAEMDDPYAAMQELCRHPLTYQALILSLMSAYPGELTMVSAIKRYLPHVEIWLAHTDGRQAAMAEALRLGADGLLTDEGLHRIAVSAPRPAPMDEPPPEVPQADPPRSMDRSEHENGLSSSEPVLTPEELRALLQDQPVLPPGGED